MTRDKKQLVVKGRVKLQTKQEHEGNVRVEVLVEEKMWGGRSSVSDGIVQTVGENDWQQFRAGAEVFLMVEAPLLLDDKPKPVASMSKQELLLEASECPDEVLDGILNDGGSAPAQIDDLADLALFVLQARQEADGDE